MAMIKWANLCHIVIIYYMTIFVISINGKSILFGKSIMELNGNIKIPVFVPISWLIHDIHSAKLIGQKSDANDMMTSDMTPDMNGNFDRQPSDDNQETSGSSHLITSRVSDNQTIETPKVQDLTPKVEHPAKIQKNIQEHPKRVTIPDKNKDAMVESAEMRLRLESNQQKFIAKQRFNEEIMYEPDVWPKAVDPLFTTIEIYEVPGVGNYMGLASNRTTFHEAPDEKPDKKDDKLKIRLKTSKDKEPKVAKVAKVKESRPKEPRVQRPKVTESVVKVSKHSNSNNYFKNYLKADTNKFNN